MMGGFFQRQLADYVEYHRDPWNCALHVVGILFLFLGVEIPLSLWNISIFGTGISLGAILALPVLIYWLLLDAALGTAILAAAILILSLATVIAHRTNSATMWSITAVLIVLGVAAQIVGHRVFEQRQPALVDNPSHLLLGPVFVMAKLFIALGFRHDLAAIIEPVPANSLSTREF